MRQNPLPSYFENIASTGISSKTLTALGMESAFNGGMTPQRAAQRQQERQAGPQQDMSWLFENKEKKPQAKSSKTDPLIQMFKDLVFAVCGQLAPVDQPQQQASVTQDEPMAKQIFLNQKKEMLPAAPTAAKPAAPAANQKAPSAFPFLNMSLN